ncbi:efflux transporter, RND family, MFP subunit [Methylobacterium sp. 4-46]|uniref:efflux RND transporter periplasmic adaptor subunit n=1 Tax=unclassified Methylobacterium TaxID=2615210 RepID=UPI000152EA71|nr:MULTISPECIES: HlyD family efflux transporter periplasmic adaptor subunit [Methylobacterium]ACA17855.1 efflux transporter, RND family, MFP subunit [Methylobacterium sp. 4-46]WFT77157.1 efflux RND transporter periplasmic adaptor subunit [Methylobacterium nodulans]
MRTLFAAALGLAALALCAGGAPAHEGHDHGSEPPAAATQAPRGHSSSERFELVAVARQGVLAVYLDRAATNEPVTNAVIQAETPAGPATAAPQPDGSFRLDAAWSEAPGEYEVVFTVEADGASEVFPVALDVHPPAAPEPGKAASRAAAWAAALDVAHDLRQHLVQRDPVALLIGGGGFVLGGLTVLLIRGRRPAIPAILVLAGAAALLSPGAARAHEGHGDESAALAAPGGRDLARRQADGSVFVPKPTQRILSIRTAITATARLPRTVELPGRVIPDPNASGVVQSAVGGRLAPPPGGFPRLGTPVRKDDVLATVTPPLQQIDVSDMRQRQGELDQQIAIVQRRVERYQRLTVSGAVAQVQLEEALDELRGLKDRRAALDRVRQQPEALVAPVDGVVAEANAVAGQMASPGAQVFLIVDPLRLWVEALSFDALSPAQTASARLADGRTLALAYRGAGLADRNQAVPVQFAVAEGNGDLRTGQFVTVLASISTPQEGLALPRASVVRGANGQSLVYEHTKPELFEPREVRVEPLDAERVLVLSGLAAGRRVVTQGAELLNQVR